MSDTTLLLLLAAAGYWLTRPAAAGGNTGNGTGAGSGFAGYDPPAGDEPGGPISPPGGGAAPAVGGSEDDPARLVHDLETGRGPARGVTGGPGRGGRVRDTLDHVAAATVVRDVRTGRGVQWTTDAPPSLLERDGQTDLDARTVPAVWDATNNALRRELERSGIPLTAGTVYYEQPDRPRRRGDGRLSLDLAG